jgi:hypothetical protein
MAQEEHKVRVDSGKYTFVKNGLAVDVLRHGEPWITLHDGINAISSFMAELDAARVVLAAAREVPKVARGDARARNVLLDQLAAALERHSALVDDREPPSAWTGTPLVVREAP